MISQLAGNVINIQSGEWVGKMSGLGAGLDSLFEYLLKVNHNLYKYTNVLFMEGKSYNA